MINKSLVSITDFNRDEFLKVLDTAGDFEKNSYQNLLQGRVIATLFFEPSTRTRLSFESAINRLGGRVIGFSDLATTSVTKGETLNDTIRVVSNFAELIVMRHPLEGSARFASEISRRPVINAGDGANQHPTQTLLDLYSIRKTQGKLDGLNICMVGDLKYGRTVHSLLMALSAFNASFHFISPDELRMPDEYKMHLNKLGLKYKESKEIESNLDKADIIYMTRVQKERFSDPIEYERTKNVYVLKDEMLMTTKETVRVMHPLPRVNEIHTNVDKSPKAYYFEQTENGVYIRQAIISLILGLK